MPYAGHWKTICPQLRRTLLSEICMDLNLELHPAHLSLWKTITPLLLENRIPQSLLWLGQAHAHKTLFVRKFVAAALCTKKEKDIQPCGECQSCCLLAQDVHPDVLYLKPDGQEKGIKAEQIRGLQTEIFQTPKCATQRFIIIESADRLNVYAANALLKILEEPPIHCVFILLAEQSSSLLPTILSRCQRFVFAGPSLPNYLALASYYDPASSRFVLMQQQEAILESLCDLIEDKISVCSLAAQWATHSLEDVLWVLYLLTSQAIVSSLVKAEMSREDALWMRFCKLANPVLLFFQLDKINVLVRKITHNINMNSTLALEHLLLGYVRKMDGR
jgi:DNA polymerase-3 subunit delta'